MKPIKIGTRGSKLALYQAYYVANLLAKHDLDTEIVIIDTKGDQILDVAISKIGSKGVFTEELEVQLEKGLIDIAVHSAKDMQSTLPAGFELIAFTEREQTNDVIISHKPEIAINDPEIQTLLGTSSTRRVATLKHFYPHIRTTEIRGNLQTRIAKMESGACDALLLAYAGVHRMGYNHLIKHVLRLDEFTPAVGQGTIAVEAFEGLDAKRRAKITQAVHDPTTGYCLEAERSYLKELDGGCSIPIFALGTYSAEQVTLTGGIVSLDGKERIERQVTGPSQQAETLGKRLAESVLTAGGKEILSKIRQQLAK
ncbi:MAG: hydroxymethylbilane synthase [Lunatimonas sp.]|uniref:hydroxymethylbilane synthase n=1 Tax=Lunatimonas sp. TaxID=2060141 RepID=UPI00263A7569|nr:hydroxymethylbilane synthase [Lunatimonas sp.]MCC5939684.1 hydroxymethylbilane synthase [Lunatimonas sp.]